MALDTNLVSYFKLDESSGDASDSVGSNTLTNTGTVAYASCLINNGADFGTTNAHSKKLENAGGLGVDMSGSYTVSTWIKVRTLPASGDTRRFIDWRSQTGTASYLLVDYNNNGGTPRIQVNSGGTTTNYNHTLSTSAFTRVTVTKSGSTITLYINGSSATTGTASNADAGAGFTLGNADGGTSIGLACYMDETAVWSRAISGAEDLELYNSGTGKAYPFGTAYSFAIALGTYTYTGFDIALTKALSMIYALGTYTYTGFDMLFGLGKGIIFETGSYIYTGFDIVLTKTLTMLFALGTYTYTGFDFILTKGMSIVISTGSYIYTGFNMILRRSGWRNTTKQSSIWTNRDKSI